MYNLLLGAIFGLWAVAGTAGASQRQCDNGGLAIYSGPDNRLLCSCPIPWKGPTCDQKFNEEDWGPFKKCKEAGKQSNCGKGLQCLEWPDDSGLRCTCDPQSKNPICTTKQNQACALAGCEPGLECTNQGCVCKPFSQNPLCQCDGKVVNLDTGKRTKCTLGKNGLCVMEKYPGKACDDHQTSALAPAPDACAPGLQLNALGQCTCVPLSSNPACAPPPVDPNLNNVCGQFQNCKNPYSVSYVVNQKNNAVTSGTSKVQPQRNYLIVTTDIVADAEYDLCVKPQDMQGWKFAADACASVDADNRCCQTVTASKGPNNFSAGCAQYAGAFSNPNC